MNFFCLSACKRYNNSIEFLGVISELFKVQKELIIDFKTEVINNDFIIKFATLFSNLPINIFIGKLYSNFILEKHLIIHSTKTNENGKCFVSIFIKKIYWI